MNLKEAIKRRDKYIEENPHLKEYQDEIDSMLDKCGNQNDRLATISILLLSKCQEALDFMSGKKIS